MNCLFPITNRKPKRTMQLTLAAGVILAAIGCHGSPPPEATPTNADAKAAAPADTKTDAPNASAATDETSATEAKDKTTELEKAPPSNAESTDCPRGGCRYTCAAGKTCDEKCKGGACDLKVEKDAKGSLDCPAGSCKINCLSGGTCNLKCGGGFCKSICAAGSTCNVDCEGKGGQCETECAKGATCDVKCPSNDCKPEPKKAKK